MSARSASLRLTSGQVGAWSARDFGAGVWQRKQKRVGAMVFPL